MSVSNSEYVPLDPQIRFMFFQLTFYLQLVNHRFTPVFFVAPFLIGKLFSMKLSPWFPLFFPTRYKVQ